MNQHDLQYIELAKAIAQMSNQGIYIADIIQQKFIYASPHPLLRCGLSEEEICNNGNSIFLKFIPAEEQALLKDYFKVINGVIQKVPVDLRDRISMALNFHVIHNKHLVMVMHKMSLLDFDAEGNPRLMLGLITPSVHSTPATFYIGVCGTEHFYQYKIENKEYVKKPIVHLSNEEVDMLRLTMQGFTIEKICNIMHKSADTIKFYRRNIFKKLNVKNIGEAIAHAITYCYI